MTGIAPTSGPTAGGTLVTIRGSHFSNVLAVYFGDLNANRYVVMSPTRIQAVAPPQAASLQTLRVITANGTSAPKLTVDPFLYVAPRPRIQRIVPTSGPTTGASTVTISGSGFTAATSVLFGSLHATALTVESDRQIVVTTPPQGPGMYPVTVITAGGVTQRTVGTSYTYVTPAPIIASITPDSGPVTGGTAVTVTGRGFLGTTSVTFGDVPAPRFTVVSSTQLVAVTPQQAPGVRFLRVTAAGQTSKPNGAGDEFDFRR